MGLAVTLKTQQERLRYSELPVFSLSLANTGAEPMTIPDPGSTMPHLRVFHLKTGAEILVEAPRRSRLPPPEMDLRPGHPAQSSFGWPRHGEPLPPGEYEISAIYPLAGGDDSAESNPIRLSIAPTSPSRLMFDTIQGDVACGVWVDLCATPPEIMRSIFRFHPGGGYGELQPLAKTSASTRPVVSCPPNLGTRDRHWIAWLEGNELKSLHVDPELGVSAVMNHRFPSGEAMLIEALHTDLAKDRSVRPMGAALVWVREGSSLQVVRLAEGGASLGARAEFSGPKPRWIESYERSGGGPFVVFLQVVEGKAILSAAPWPGMGAKPDRITQFAAWEGLFVASSATMDFEDCVRGATVLWTGYDPMILERIDWSIDSAGAFEEKGRTAIDWNMFEPIRRALVRVSREGTVATVLQDGKGKWHLHLDGVKPIPAGPSIHGFELAFLGGREPVLVYPQPELGFRMMMADGSPLPEAAW